ncbi:MAG: response regulator transcription factor [Opitutae bacterium]|nr:response regulator transcription factor [Opitutae bacterium]
MQRIKTLVADDEKIARRMVRDLLGADPEIQVVAEADDGETALEAMKAQRPELALLDIHMPIMTGLEALLHLKPSERPEVVFVTAFDEHAIKAFELHAVDYVVKPFSDDRFHQALERAKRRLRGDLLEDTQRAVTSLLAHLAKKTEPAPPPPLAAAPAKDAPFVLKVDGEHHFVSQADIRWIEAQGDYIRVHTTQRNLLTRMTLTHALEQLSAARFVRIHKSCVVNTAYVRRLKPTTAWGRPLELDDGTTLNISRSYRCAVEQLL